MDREGFLYFVDRLDDIIKTRGEKVAPRQIEEVIARLPGVAEVSVYGVPDELLGEAVAASVALMPGTHLTRARIQRHCLEHLESFMVPRFIDIREALPTTTNGKINRRALRAAASGGIGMSVPTLSRQLLEIDAAATAEQIEASIRRTVGRLRRRGVVVALSGGIDSASSARSPRGRLDRIAWWPCSCRRRTLLRRVCAWAGHSRRRSTSRRSSKTSRPR